MLSFRARFRPRRALAALLLLTALVVGVAADAAHHLSERGCAAEGGRRDDRCTCTSLHATSLAREAPAQSVPIVLPREFAFVPAAPAPKPRAVAGAPPRAPPLG